MTGAMAAPGNPFCTISSSACARLAQLLFPLITTPNQLCSHGACREGSGIQAQGTCQAGNQRASGGGSGLQVMLQESLEQPSASCPELHLVPTSATQSVCGPLAPATLLGFIRNAGTQAPGSLKQDLRWDQATPRSLRGPGLGLFSHPWLRGACGRGT